jgi:tetratricopeptide (TPR) repeat protein
LAFSYYSIGQVYYNMGEYTKALSHYEKELGIQQETLPANHPDLATSYSNIGWLYSKMGEQTVLIIEVPSPNAWSGLYPLRSAVTAVLSCLPFLLCLVLFLFSVCYRFL